MGNDDPNDNIHRDYALVKVDRDFAWTREVKLVCLPADDGETFAGVWAMATGWGRTWNHNEDTADTLREVQEWVQVQEFNTVHY